MEGATPHTGEVVRIKVGADKGESIRREDKEISPRYNGHKVTIKVGAYLDPEVDRNGLDTFFNRT